MVKIGQNYVHVVLNDPLCLENGNSHFPLNAKQLRIRDHTISELFHGIYFLKLSIKPFFKREIAPVQLLTHLICSNNSEKQIWPNLFIKNVFAFVQLSKFFFVDS